MKKVKKQPLPLIGLPNNDKLLVQKSRKLNMLWSSDYTLPEFKILEVYMARINAQDSSKTAVRFSKGELERILGVEKLNLPDLQKRLVHLLNPITIVGDNGEHLLVLNLFEFADCHQDKNGLWQIDLQCTQKARSYFFNLKSYFQYQLNAVVNLTSKTSYLLFQYVESRRLQKTGVAVTTWEESVDSLRRHLGVDGVKTYNEFFRFNGFVLKKAVDELREKAHLDISYLPIKQGRGVTRVEFTVGNTPLNMSGSVHIDAVDDLQGFTDAEKETIRNRLQGDFDLLDEAYEAFIRMEKIKIQAGKPLDNRCSYFCAIISKIRGTARKKEKEKFYSDWAEFMKDTGL